MEKFEAILAKHAFTKNLDPKHIKAITGCAREVTFQTGQEIMKQGQTADSFYLITHGKVAVQTFVEQKGGVIIQTLDEGDVLGWSWMTPPYQWTFEATAMTLARAVCIDARGVKGKIEQDDELGYQLMKLFATVIAKRLEAARLQVLEL